MCVLHVCCVLCVVWGVVTMCFVTVCCVGSVLQCCVLCFEGFTMCVLQCCVCWCCVCKMCVFLKVGKVCYKGVFVFYSVLCVSVLQLCVGMCYNCVLCVVCCVLCVRRR
ncbi:hypothetical protein QTP70_010087 [Hemibagrus guttatus]|uniref:Uncharacterized protein n=1 Tax=Hemibagrus guttatus TaxID=175788 RepID=A0AAE0ULU0_9TELE|nr:hypothetical protein QTP70_010087 [Hemibagrus guttatus]